MINRAQNNQQGIMLVELILVLALLGLVLSIGYMYLSFGSSTYARSEKQAIAQQSIRSCASFITTDIRYASEVALYNSSNKPANPGYRYIYLDGDSVYYALGSEIQRTLLDSAADSIAYSLEFSRKLTNHEGQELKGDNLVISLVIVAEDDLYSLETSVQILNLRLSSGDYSDHSGDLSVVAIEYKRPWD